MNSHKTITALLLLILSSFSIKAEKIFDIPFVINAKGQILIQAHLNNHAEPKIFVLSTTEKSMIRSDKRQELFDMKIDTSSIKLKLNSLSFPGGFAFRDIKLDWKNMSNRKLEQYSDQIYGIIGPSLLRHYTCQFDFTTNRLKIVNDVNSLNIPKSTPSTYFSSSFLNWYPYVEVYADNLNRPKEALIDINSLLGINLLQEDIQFSNDAFDVVAQHIHKDEKLRATIMKNTSINKIEIGDILVTISDDYPAVIGLDFLRKYIVTIDFVDKKLYLESAIKK